MVDSSGRCWARALSREEWSLGALRNNNRSQCLEELPRHASCAFITPCSLNLSPEERLGGGGGTSNGTHPLYQAEKGEVPARKGGG
jgi:hypothetical protein